MQILIDDAVYREIVNAIGKNDPESGGILGGKELHCQKFYFDSTSIHSSNTYKPNTSKANEVIKQWYSDNIEFIGIIHSHPEHIKQLSYSDIQYAYKLMKLNSFSHFIMIVCVGNPAKEDFSMNGYLLTEGTKENEKLNIIIKE